MRRLAFKRVSWLPSVRRITYSKMSPASTSNAMSENVALLDGQPQKRCCCGRYRAYGSDSAWSWAVAFANFLVNLIIVGLGRMSGILYVDFMHIFNIDRKTASVPFSIQQAARNFFGPVAGILGQKYGLRAVTILGGIIGSLSAVLIYFKMDIMSITILWGLLYGASTAFTTTLNQVSIDQYFEKNRATAGGFAFSGGCVGALFFPAVLETLIYHYGMKGTFLVLGAILLHVIPAAIMLADPPWKESDIDDEKYKQNITQYGAFKVGEPAHTVTKVTEERNQITETREIRLPSHAIDFAILRESSDIVFQMLTMETPDESIRIGINKNNSQKVSQARLLKDLECVYSLFSNPEKKLDTFPSSQVLIDSEKESTTSKLEKGHSSVVSTDAEINEDDLSIKIYNEIPPKVYIQNKLQDLYEMRGTRIISHFYYLDQPRACKVLTELRKLYEKLLEEPNFQTIRNKAQYFITSISKEIEETPVKLDTNKHSNSFCSHIETAIKLHGNPLFLLICLCRGVFMLTFIPVVTVIVDFVMDQGLKKSDGNYAIAALSLGDFLGRLCLGWITDRGFLTLPRYMLVFMILLGGSTAALPLLYSKISILAAVLIFGILQGSLFVRHPLLVSQYMENHEQSIGMGFINFLSGLLGFALPAFIGYFRDSHGSYNEMFYINGIICAAVGLLWGLEPIFNRTSSSEKSKKRLQHS